MTARIGLGFVLFPCRLSRRRGRPGNPVSLVGSAPAASRREASSVVLLRHGQSIWNKIPTFSGWCDVPLTPQGIAEAQGAGQLLSDRGYTFDVAFTSELQRAGQTCREALQVLDPSVPIVENWQLNERHYGALQGRSKRDPQLKAQYGSEQLKAWRREFHAAPPAMETSHPYYQNPPAPSTESLADCQKRVLKYWHESIVPALALGDGATVLLVAHANTIRGLVAFLDDVLPEDIPGIHIPNSVPCIYHIDPQTGTAIHNDDSNTSSISRSKGHWLLSAENQQRLVDNLGGNSEIFARSVFDAWDTNGDGILSKEELTTGLFMWKSAEDRAMSALVGKLWEELNKAAGSEPITMDTFQAHAVMGCRKHNLPFFLDENA